MPLEFAKYSWYEEQPYWFAPSVLALREINKLKHAYKIPDNYQGGDDVWTRFMARHVAEIFDENYETIHSFYRRLKRRESLTCKLENVEKILLAQGIIIDSTNIPTLPGNRRLAKELIEIRSENEEDSPLDKKEMQEKVDLVMKLSNCIVNDISHMEYYQDQAPYDCLRPPTFVL